MLIESLVGSGLGFATGMAGHFFLRRKNKAEAQSSELDNVKKAIEIWRELAQNLEKEIEELRAKIEMIEEGFTRKCERCRYKKVYYQNQNDRENDKHQA